MDDTKWVGDRPLADELREALCNWARANNLDPGRIPADATITIDEHATTITTEVWLVRDGKPVVGRNTLLTEPVTVPLVARPPDTIAHRLTFIGGSGDREVWKP
ncbi:hypothetical protein ACFYUR_21995 [Micromonospora haikouensis]|uniref:hypothetical protein n=1 Tax=Micromonospora haikouensis TaxID=686309 RepID=UPI0036BAEF6C